MQREHLAFFGQDPFALHPRFAPVLPKKQGGTAGCLWLPVVAETARGKSICSLLQSDMNQLERVPKGPLCSGKGNKPRPVNPCPHLQQPAK